MKRLYLSAFFIVTSAVMSRAQLANTAYGAGTSSSRGNLNSIFGFNNDIVQVFFTCAKE